MYLGKILAQHDQGNMPDISVINTHRHLYMKKLLFRTVTFLHLSYYFEAYGSDIFSKIFFTMRPSKKFPEGSLSKLILLY